MSKTKQDKSVDTPEQSTKSTATATTTKTPSASSGTTGVNMDDFTCPVCGAAHRIFKAKVDGDDTHVWCGNCGTNTSEWVRGERREAQVKSIVESQLGPTSPIHPDTPTCDHPTFTRDGVEVKCGSRRWAHDGKSIQYCGKCGRNYTGKPVSAAVIASLGLAKEILMEPVSPLNAKQIERLEKERRGETAGK